MPPKNGVSSSKKKIKSLSLQQQQQQQGQRTTMATREEFEELRDYGNGNGIAGLVCGIIRLRALRHLYTLTDITQRWPTPPYTLSWPSSSSNNNNNNSISVPISNS